MTDRTYAPFDPASPSEQRRNDLAARERARQVIERNSALVRQINELLQQADRLAQDLDIRGDGLTRQVQSAVWQAKHAVDRNVRFFDEKPNDTYLGNMAAAGHYEPR